MVRCVGTAKTEMAKKTRGRLEKCLLPQPARRTVSISGSPLGTLSAARRRRKRMEDGGAPTVKSHFEWRTDDRIVVFKKMEAQKKVRRYAGPMVPRKERSTVTVALRMATNVQKKKEGMQHFEELTGCSEQGLPVRGSSSSVQTTPGRPTRCCQRIQQGAMVRMIVAPKP